MPLVWDFVLMCGCGHLQSEKLHSVVFVNTNFCNLNSCFRKGFTNTIPLILENISYQCLSKVLSSRFGAFNRKLRTDVETFSVPSGTFCISIVHVFLDISSFHLLILHIAPIVIPPAPYRLWGFWCVWGVWSSEPVEVAWRRLWDGSGRSSGGSGKFGEARGWSEREIKV